MFFKYIKKTVNQPLKNKKRKHNQLGPDLKSSDENVSELNFFQYATPIKSVCEFIKSICLKVFTVQNLWGNKKNLSSFLSSIDRYIYLRRGENIAVSKLRSKLKCCHMRFIQKSHSMNDGVGDGGDKKIKAGLIDVTLNHLIYWIFNDFINPLLSVCFYVTEGEGIGSELLYYRKPTWAFLMKKGEEQLKNTFTLVRWIFMIITFYTYIFCFYQIIRVSNIIIFFFFFLFVL